MLAIHNGLLQAHAVMSRAELCCAVFSVYNGFPALDWTSQNSENSAELCYWLKFICYWHCLYISCLSTTGTLGLYEMPVWWALQTVIFVYYNTNNYIVWFLDRTIKKTLHTRFHYNYWHYNDIWLCYNDKYVCITYKENILIICQKTKIIEGFSLSSAFVEDWPYTYEKIVIGSHLISFCVISL